MTSSGDGSQDVRSRVTDLVSHHRDYRQEIRDLTQRYKYVVFYGCGMILDGIVGMWQTHVGRDIDFCCDSDSRKWGKYFSGALCLSPAELAAIKDESAVFVTIGDFSQVYDSLRAAGFPAVNLLFKYDLAASEALAKLDSQDVIDRLCAARELLSDDQSVTVFDAIVSRVLDGGGPEIMREVCESDQYFPADIIALSQHERLVDVGAFDGDTIRDFVGRTSGRFDRIFSFEVDAANFAALRENVGLMPERDRIQLFELGLWDVERDIKYSVGESNSTIGAGAGRGHVVPMDKVLADEHVTLVKMDIEGAEPNALRGATTIIKRDTPRLAVCVYHDFTHLWEIPLFIHGIVPKYRIYLRHHNCMEYETVCYAVC